MPRCVKNKAHMTFDKSVLEIPSHWIDGCVYLCRIHLPSYSFLKSLMIRLVLCSIHLKPSRVSKNLSNHMLPGALGYQIWYPNPSINIQQFFCWPLEFRPVLQSSSSIFIFQLF